MKNKGKTPTVVYLMFISLPGMFGHKMSVECKLLRQLILKIFMSSPATWEGAGVCVCVCVCCEDMYML